MAFFCKSYENVLIWVFLHAEFISALKTEPKPLDFLLRNMQKMERKYLSLFSIFVIVFKSLKQKCLIPTESCFLDQPKMSNTN